MARHEQNKKTLLLNVIWLFKKGACLYNIFRELLLYKIN